MKVTRANKQIQQFCKLQYPHTKSDVFYTLAMNNPKNNFKKTIPFTVASKRTKDLGIHLTEEVKDWY